MNLLKQIENEQVAKLTAGKEIPEFQPGDTVVVNVLGRDIAAKVAAAQRPAPPWCAHHRAAGFCGRPAERGRRQGGGVIRDLCQDLCQKLQNGVENGQAPHTL